MKSSIKLDDAISCIFDFTHHCALSSHLILLLFCTITKRIRNQNISTLVKVFEHIFWHLRYAQFQLLSFLFFSVP